MSRLIPFLIVVLSALPLAAETSPEDAVRSVLKTQIESWNAGDIEAFCQPYAVDTLFLSPSGLTRGREEVLARYRARYLAEDAPGMGQLELKIMDIQWFQHQGRRVGATVVGSWHLRFEDGSQAEGFTAIGFERKGEVWQIVVDASMGSSPG